VTREWWIATAVQAKMRQPGEAQVAHNMRTRQFLMVLSASLSFLAAISTCGVCSEPAPRVCTEFFDSDAVFAGTVISMRTVREEEFTEGWSYRLHVEKSFRGPTGPVIEVYTGNDSARYPLEKGRKYLLFARSFKGKLHIADCGQPKNSGFLKDSAGVIDQINQIRDTKSGGEVAGRIGRENGPDFAGVRIVVEGTNGRFEGATDTNSWFHIKVPEGRYRVRAESPDHVFVAWDLSYDNPDHIVVHRGGCPQMQFVPR
jgi:hypothetical protein